MKFDCAAPPHLPGNAVYLAWCGGVHQRAIMQEETIRRKVRAARLSPRFGLARVFCPALRSTPARSRSPGGRVKTVTEGLDGLRDRLAEYRALGAHFGKWRAVIHVAHDLPSSACVTANAHALARYAALCQEQELVPIVEPEVLMEGSHAIERCEDVTGAVLQAVFEALIGQDVVLEAMLLKPNMVIPGEDCGEPASVDDVATATLRCLRRYVPVAVPGIVFLSGGQDERLATAHLNAINRLPGPKPWTISFSYGRALQDPAIEAWRGRPENLAAGGEALARRARCNAAASLGTYTDEMEAVRGRRSAAPPRLARRLTSSTANDCAAPSAQSRFTEAMMSLSDRERTSTALSDSDLTLLDAYWRAANYLSVGQIYLFDNPLLKETLSENHIKPRLLGHWGTTPGLNFIYAHLNRIIKKHDLNMIYITGPGHGGPAWWPTPTSKAPIARSIRTSRPTRRA